MWRRIIRMSLMCGSVDCIIGGGFKKWRLRGGGMVKKMRLLVVLVVLHVVVKMMETGGMGFDLGLGFDGVI